MTLQNHSSFVKLNQKEESNAPGIVKQNEAAEEDTDPPLDEEDLEENNLTVEEADQIIWDEPAESSSGPEEKDITD